MSRRRAKLSDQIRAAVATAGVSRYRICKGAGIDQGALSRFLARKQGLGLARLDALADVLGLDVVKVRPVRVPPRKKAGRKPGRPAETDGDEEVRKLMEGLAAANLENLPDGERESPQRKPKPRKGAKP